MLKDQELHRRIEAAVGDAERETSAEIVVVLARQSGSYRDVDFAAGGLLALVILTAMLFAPFFVVSPYLVLPYVVAVFVLGVAVSAGSRVVRSTLTTAGRRRKQASEGALLAFVSEGVAGTRARNGLLVYLSLFEQSLEILPDAGLDARIPRAEWNRIRHGFMSAPRQRRPKALLEVVAACGKVLARAFPAAADNPNEISNRPRILP